MPCAFAVCVCVRERERERMCLSECVCVCMHMYIYTQTYVNLHIHTYTHTHTHTYTHTQVERRGTRARIVYVAPLKALAREITAKFSQSLQPLGLKVRELTGDMKLSLGERKSTNMIVTTPEKWDVITRKNGGREDDFERTHLMILDEIHLLNEEREYACIRAALRHTVCMYACMCACMYACVYVCN